MSGIKDGIFQLHYWEVYDNFYAYGKDLAYTSEHHINTAQLESMALQGLEVVAYDLMHSLLWQYAKQQGIDGCLTGWRVHRRS